MTVESVRRLYKNPLMKLSNAYSQFYPKSYFNGQSASTNDSKFGKTLPNRQISFHSDTGLPVKCSFLTPSWASVFLYVEHVESPATRDFFNFKITAPF